jgi:flagellin
MGLTATNINSLQLLNIVNRTQQNQANVLTQLSTGSRINTGKDDPAGLIALANLNAELVAVDAAIKGNQRTDSQLAVADASLTEVSSLLSEIESLVAASSNSDALSASEISANQAQIDSAIDSIDRIMRTTSFNGKKLLDGSLAINTTGVDNTKVQNLRVFSRPQATSSIQVVATVTASAQTASASFGAVFNTAGTNINTSGSTELTIQGTLGTSTLTIGSGLTRTAIVAAINTATAQTGVSASVVNNYINLNTTGFGTDELISVDVLSGGVLKTQGGGTATITETSTQYGVDAGVTVNGQTANVDGLNVNFTANGVSFEYSLEEDYGFGRTANRSNTETFTIELTGGATFQLGADDTTRQTIGLNSLFSNQLGGGDAGAFLNNLRGGSTADLNTDVATALKTIKKAITDVATERGRIGAFQKFQVQTSINSLNATKTGLTNATSIIGDTDYAVASAELNRQNVLLNAGISLLGLANQQTGAILALLG